MAHYSIIIADDHPIFRKGLKHLIEEDYYLKVIGEAGDGIELLELLKNTVPDMVILDISMPRLRGLEAISEIRAMNPEISILVLTMFKSKEYLFHTISSGARGYLLKEDTDKELFAAIRTIRNGNIYVTSALATFISEYDSSRDKYRKVDNKPELLTNREKQVLKLVAEGKTSKQVARLLNISIRTVENHRASIMRKLRLKNTAELVKYAVENGFLSIFTKNPL